MSRRYRRAGFSVDDATGSRFDLAMELFRAGKPFEFHEVAFRITDGRVVQCLVESSWQAKNVTPATANDDFAEGESAFRYLLDKSTEFRDAVADRPVTYELVEDYGMGSILICSRKDGTVEWAHGYPRSAG